LCSNFSSKLTRTFSHIFESGKSSLNSLTWFTIFEIWFEKSLTISISFIFRPSNCLLRFKICIFLDFSSPWNLTFNLSHAYLAVWQAIILKISSLTALRKQVRALYRFFFSLLKNFIYAIVGLFSSEVGCLSHSPENQRP
jgi:hypothetical protein